MYTGTNIRVDGTKADFAFGMNLYGQDFAFVPESVLNKGFISGEKQYYLPAVLDPGFQEKIAPYSKTFSIDNVSEFGGKEFVKQYEKSGFADTQGYLVPENLVYDLSKKVSFYDVNKGNDGFVFGPITGIGTNEAGVRYYNVAASGRPNPSAFIAPDGELQGHWYDPGKKWYETTLGKIGIALIVAGTAGLAAGAAPAAAGGSAAGGAAGGAAAGGTAAAGTGAAAGGIVGTPGVSTIFPVAAPVAPTVSTIAPIATAGAGMSAGAASGAGAAAPISTATPVPAGELAYPGVEVAPSFTPAPDSLQAALPGMGVETAASAAPYTAAPGSFQAALPAFGVASSPSLAGNLTATSSGISATDALRLANQARGLLGAGQNPIVPQQQGLPQGGGQAQGVDYSGLLSLLQLQAGTPGVSSLTRPAQLRQMYQTTLLPDVLSLLG
jgi:hypothetical protein